MYSLNVLEVELGGCATADRRCKGGKLRRTVLLLVTMVVASMLGTGVALAAAISGTQGNDTLRGTRQVDQIYGLNGNDTLVGRARGDELYGGAGNDNLYGSSGADDIYGGSGQDDLFGGSGADFLNSADRGTTDIVNCGGADEAVDEVVRDENDVLVGCTQEDQEQETVVP
jgi:Ca2+-binding RTX toxin-like protein